MQNDNGHVVAVVGSRDFDDYELLCKQLDPIEIRSIVSGGAKGADSLAERYAQEHGIPIKVILPNWQLYGRGAGMVRNQAIVETACMVVAFWDGSSKGTANSIDHARKLSKSLMIVRYEETNEPS